MIKFVKNGTLEETTLISGVPHGTSIITRQDRSTLTIEYENGEPKTVVDSRLRFSQIELEKCPTDVCNEMLD